MTHQRKISVIGLGYVGLPVAVAFGKQAAGLGARNSASGASGASGVVIGFDIDLGRIAELQARRDRTGEVSPEELQAARIHFTANPGDLGQADFHIVAVPTPIDAGHKPDLRALESASKLVGGQLKRGHIVVYESTVYPGATEEVCLPILEAESGLRAGVDFFIGYSPERINPGDKEHTFTRVTKIVSGQDAATLEIVAAVYESVVEAGVHRTPDIRTAEAAKVIENTQRDLNIALINELAMLFHRMSIDTQAVLEAAGTKWNFLPFVPGLVGGHCIGVDPYYLTYKAEQVGYHPEVILAGRRINDAMGEFVAREIVLQLARAGVSLKDGRVGVLGVTFKEDVSDIRNSKVIDVVRELQKYTLQVSICDPFADPAEFKLEYGLELTPLEEMAPLDAVVLAVPHRPYRERGWEGVQGLLKNRRGLVADLKSVLERETCPPGVELWRL